MATDLSRLQVEQLALIMQFLYQQGFDLDTVKRAADAWWQTKKEVPRGE